MAVAGSSLVINYPILVKKNITSFSFYVFGRNSEISFAYTRIELTKIEDSQSYCTWQKITQTSFEPIYYNVSAKVNEFAINNDSFADKFASSDSVKCPITKYMVSMNETDEPLT